MTAFVKGAMSPKTVLACQISASSMLSDGNRVTAVTQAVYRLASAPEIKPASALLAHRLGESIGLEQVQLGVTRPERGSIAASVLAFARLTSV